MKSLPILLAILLAVAEASESKWWTHELVVSPHVELKWSISDPDYITLEMLGKTQGYVGIGFSPNGGMAGSDIILGWVDDQGKPHLHDCHGTGRDVAPKLDPQDDLELEDFSQTEAGTRIRFRRKWSTCDDHDAPIGEDTMKLIWAVSPTDPEDMSFHYHAGLRGTRSVFMKQHQTAKGFPDEDLISAEANRIKHWDIRMDQYLVPTRDTHYHCKIFKFPKIAKKHHIIAHRPVLTKGNEQFVHHINVFKCIVPEFVGKTTADIFDHYVEDNHGGADCYSSSSPVEWREYCFALQLTISVGSEGNILPLDIGDPIEPDANGFNYLKLEVHYDNPQKLSILDSSGIRIFYTDQLREKELSMLFAGHRRTPFLTIPPGQKKFTITGFCSADCTKEGIPESGVTLYSILLHAHLKGRKITMRHIRAGQELEPIVDNTYDFNYQQYRTLNHEIKILPGDELIVECDYDTSGSGFMFGGLSTSREMCEVFIHYYPKADLVDCRSQPEFYNYFGALDIADVFRNNVLKRMNLPPSKLLKEDVAVPDDAYILEYGKVAETEGDIFEKINILKPIKYEHQTVYEHMKTLSWNNQTFAQNVENLWASRDHYMHCANSKGRKIDAQGLLKKIQPYKPFTFPPSQCPARQRMVNNAEGHGKPLKVILLSLAFLLVTSSPWLSFSK